MQPFPMSAVIDRRLLVNWRADPAMVAALLPPGMRPQAVDGAAVVGVCAVRLVDVRPEGFPRWLGRTVEAAAHRVAIEGPDGPAVYVLRRDTSSWLGSVVGGRLAPGVYNRLPIDVRETETSWHLAFGETELHGELDAASTSSLFGDLHAASGFFRTGSVAYSANRRGMEAVELDAEGWSFEPVRMLTARSNWDELGAELDSAYVMRRVPVTWRPVPVRLSSPARPRP